VMIESITGKKVIHFEAHEMIKVNLFLD